MIQLEHISKRYVGPSGTVDALKDVSVHVEKGDIYGIIGSSGAGKSTLLRMVNQLEKPDTGTVTVAGRELSTLSKAELRKMRRKIGMVFQQFNLLESKTVFQNVAIPLILEGDILRRSDGQGGLPLTGIVQADSIGIHPLAVVGRQLQGGGTAPHLQILSPYVQGQLLSAVSALCSAAGGQGQAEYHH